MASCERLHRLGVVEGAGDRLAHRMAIDVRLVEVGPRVVVHLARAGDAAHVLRREGQRQEGVDDRVRQHVRQRPVPIGRFVPRSAAARLFSSDALTPAAVVRPSMLAVGGRQVGDPFSKSARRAAGPRWHTSRADATPRAAKVIDSLGERVSADRRPPIQGGWGGCSGSRTRKNNQSADGWVIEAAWGRGATGMGPFRGSGSVPAAQQFAGIANPCRAWRLPDRVRIGQHYMEFSFAVAARPPLSGVGESRGRLPESRRLRPPAVRAADQGRAELKGDPGGRPFALQNPMVAP